MLNQLQYCEETGIPLAVIIGESELQKGIVKLRVIETREETEIPRNELVQILKSKIAELNWSKMKIQNKSRFVITLLDWTFIIYQKLRNSTFEQIKTIINKEDRINLQFLWKTIGNRYTLVRLDSRFFCRNTPKLWKVYFLHFCIFLKHSKNFFARKCLVMICSCSQCRWKF